MRTLGRFPFAALLFAALASAGCANEILPPPAAPARVIPPVSWAPTSAPNAGQGEILLDTVEGRAQAVEDVQPQLPTAGTLATAELNGGAIDTSVLSSLFQPRPLCDTPCIVDLPYGPHQITLNLTDANGNARTITDIVEVGPKPSAYRAALGGEYVHPDLSGAGLITASLASIGLMTGPLFYLNRSSHGLATALTIGSAVALVGGIVLLIEGRTADQVGTGVEWNP